MNKHVSYNASHIEVLSGLDPVRKRPGMYTDTSRPNHLVQEVVDNSVDEALAGYASEIKIILYQDNSVEVIDNGRGMPIDLHPEEGVSGVELILTRLHAGAKFSNQQYRFAGGLHGVGVSVVNALSSRLDVKIKRDGKIYQMLFASGEKVSELNAIGKTAVRDTGTSVKFWADPKYFDSPKLNFAKLKHLLRAKAVLCSGLKIIFENLQTAEMDTWQYENGLSQYLLEPIQAIERIPFEPFMGEFAAENHAIAWAVCWIPEAQNFIAESYVNLIPTIQGGTHVNGFRAGLLEAMREFCELRNLLPRGIKLLPEDIWKNCSHVLSIKMKDPQFAGQTKERLSSSECTSFVSGVVRDAFSLWLNQHVQMGEQLAEFIVGNAEQRLKEEKKITRKKITVGPALPGKLADCISQDMEKGELFLVEGESAGGSAKQARDRVYQAIMPLRGKILNTWEVHTDQLLASQEVHDITVALGVDPHSADLNSLRYGKICILADADSDGLHIATLLCALFIKHFKPLVLAGRIYVALPPLYRIDIGKEVYYALDEAEKEGLLERIAAEKKPGKINIQRFKGLGEMNPLQLRETTMLPGSRRLLQLTAETGEDPEAILDMLLAKKRASDRKLWLETKGNLAEI